jgi:hypothetical protein
MGGLPGKDVDNFIKLPSVPSKRTELAGSIPVKFEADTEIG